MSKQIKYNDRGEVVSVNGLTTGHHIGTPMQDAIGTEEENSAYGEEMSTVGNSENVKDEEQPKPSGGSWNDLKDKPFYEEVKENQVLFEDTINEQYAEVGNIALIIGETYSVTINDTEYNVECFDDGTGTPIIGSMSLWMDEDYIETEPPFFYGNGWIGFATDGEYQVKIVGDLRILKQIEHKYIEKEEYAVQTYDLYRFFNTECGVSLSCHEAHNGQNLLMQEIPMTKETWDKLCYIFNRAVKGEALITIVERGIAINPLKIENTLSFRVHNFYCEYDSGFFDFSIVSVKLEYNEEEGICREIIANAVSTAISLS